MLEGSVRRRRGGQILDELLVPVIHQVVDCYERLEGHRPFHVSGASQETFDQFRYANIWLVGGRCQVCCFVANTFSLLVVLLLRSMSNDQVLTGEVLLFGAQYFARGRLEHYKRQTLARDEIFHRLDFVLERLAACARHRQQHDTICVCQIFSLIVLKVTIRLVRCNIIHGEHCVVVVGQYLGTLFTLL